MTSQHTLQPNLKALTGLRFFAAIHVVIFHYGRQATPFNSGLWGKWAQMGPLAVSFFFVLSGFILAWVYSARPSLTCPANRARYYRARISRIYPMYLLAIVAAVFLFIRYSPFTPETQASYVGKIFMNLFMVQAWLPGLPMAINGPAWSLSVEAFFYIIFPFLFPRILELKTRNLWIILVCVWLVNVTLNYWAFHLWAPGHSGAMVKDLRLYAPVFHVSSFLIGVGVGISARRWKNQTRWSLAWTCVFFMCLLSWFFMADILVWLATFFREWSGHSIAWIGMAHNGFLAPFFSLFICAVLFGHPRIERYLGSRLAVFLGGASYGIYLFQYPAWTFLRFEVFKPLAVLDPGVKIAAEIVLLVVVGSLLFKYFETPIRRLLNRSKLTPVASPLPAEHVHKKAGLT